MTKNVKTKQPVVYSEVFICDINKWLKIAYHVTLIRYAPIVLLVLCSCSSNSKITGTIQEIRGDTLIGKYHSFTVKDASKRHVGETVTFTRTVNRSKINSKKVQ